MSLVLSDSLSGFFRAQFLEIAKKQQVLIQEGTEFYVVNLLAEFAVSEKLFNQHVEGKRDTEALALMYHRALSQERAERIKTLRHLGDASLYTAGFFSQSLDERTVGSDYYVNMGKTAYGAIAQLAQPSSFQSVYIELQTQFSALVRVLKEMAARCLASQGPEGQLRVFEHWVRSKDERLEAVLLDADVFRKGMLPS
jgi:hypothetical protein